MYQREVVYWETGWRNNNRIKKEIERKIRRRRGEEAIKVEIPRGSKLFREWLYRYSYRNKRNPNLIKIKKIKKEIVELEIPPKIEESNLPFQLY